LVGAEHAWGWMKEMVVVEEKQGNFWLTHSWILIYLNFTSHAIGNNQGFLKKKDFICIIQVVS
jgi:hypothetical protein